MHDHTTRHRIPNWVFQLGSMFILMGFSVVALLPGPDGTWPLVFQRVDPAFFGLITAAVGMLALSFAIIITRGVEELKAARLEIKKLREDHKDYDELQLHSQVLWALDSQMLPYIQSAVSTPRDLAKGHGLNTVLQIVARMVEKIHFVLEEPDKLVRTEGNVGRVYLAEFLEELDRVAPPRIRR